MFKHEPPISIDREMKMGEPENPLITLSRLKEELRDFEDHIGTDNPTPDDTVDIALKKEQIAKLEESMDRQKAA